MIVAMSQWKRAYPGAPVHGRQCRDVAMDNDRRCRGIAIIVLPASMGWVDTVDVGLTRTLFSWTLHPIVYFWLFPAYIAFYTMAPQAAGGCLYSDTLGRLSFVLILLYSLPVGLHHLLMDSEQSTGFKFVQMMLTILVSVPTLLTVFTIAASMEIAGRLRGGRGLFGSRLCHGSARWCSRLGYRSLCSSSAAAAGSLTSATASMRSFTTLPG
jgi:cytochrome c oxidase subunit 1